MRIMRKSIVAIITSICLSAAAFASPINVESYAVTVPNTLTLGQDDNSDMTQSDFVAATPYVVDLAVATHVPIKLSTEFTPLELDSRANAAVMQNSNFEN